LQEPGWFPQGAQSPQAFLRTKILLDWGKAVKNGIAEITDGNEYPHPVEENYTTTRPKLHNYF